MKRILFILLLSVIGLHGFAQLTLQQIHDMARQHYPVIKQYQLVSQSKEYTLDNAAKAYLPQIKISMGANVFTKMVEFPVQTAALIGDTKNHLLNASVQVNQMIYDGGATSVQKKMAAAQATVDENQLNVRMYDINRQVDQLFFSILLFDEQLRQVKLLQDDLALGRKTVEGLMNGGLANASDLDAVEVEQIQANQQEGSLLASRKAYLRMLGLFIGRELSDSTAFERPTPLEPSLADATQRPELMYFAAQSKLLGEQRKMLDVQLKPKLSAFALGSYQSKVFDFMKNQMLAGGLSLSWNIAPLYTRKNDLKQLETKQKQIESEREAFLFNNRLQNEQLRGVVDDLKEKIGQDDRIIALRENIRAKSSKKVQNGIETVNEMLRDVNAVSQARQQKAIHEILLLQEIYQIKNINNN